MNLKPLIFSASLLVPLSTGLAAEKPSELFTWSEAAKHCNSSVKNLRIKPIWAPNEDAFVYRKQHDNGWAYMLVTTKTGAERPAFDHKGMSDDLKALGDRFYHHDKLPLRELSYTRKGLEFSIGKKRYRRSKDALQKIEAPRPAGKRAKKKKHYNTVSPDGKWHAFNQNGAIHITNTDTRETTILAAAPAKGKSYNRYIHWNKASTHFYVLHTTEGQRRTINIVESSPKDQLQPKLHTLRYDKPGDKIDLVVPHIFSVNSSNIIVPDTSLTENAFSITHVSWCPNDQEISYEYVERGFGKHRLIRTNATTGKHRLLADEESDTFIYVHGIRFRHDLPSTNEMIWGSDRDGWRHLYLIDTKTGQVKNQITKGDWLVRDVLEIDELKREIIFTASGYNTKEDPYHKHVFCVNFDGTQLRRLTVADGTHSIALSPNKKFYIDTWSRVDHPPVHELRSFHNGALIHTLTKTDATTLTKSGFALPKRFVCKDRNGKFDIWGMIITPPNFDPKQKYPVIESIYSGPHGAFVPKHFSAWWNHLSELAQEGFIVVKIDGLGTNYRHRDFWHYSYKNLVDGGLPDRIKWIKEAAKTFPFMDTSRVGIYGGSAGGQSSTAAVLHHGNFYKAAVSDCGCHDNRLDKIWWNEQWMDWPVGPHYAKQSNVTNAHKLSGALMLTVGELDKNVDPASTVQLVNALIKAKKDFEFFSIPGAGHSAGEITYMRRKRAQFFHKHLNSSKGTAGE